MSTSSSPSSSLSSSWKYGCGYSCNANKKQDSKPVWKYGCGYLCSGSSGSAGSTKLGKKDDSKTSTTSISDSDASSNTGSNTRRNTGSNAGPVRTGVYPVRTSNEHVSKSGYPDSTIQLNCSTYSKIPKFTLRKQVISREAILKKKVISAQIFQRPLKLIGRKLIQCTAIPKVTQTSLSNDGWLKHSGMVVTTDQDGKRYLIHKGFFSGNTCQKTIVDDAGKTNPGSKWRPFSPPKQVSGKTVGDYVTASGPRYDIMQDNCHHATRRMAALSGIDIIKYSIKERARSKCPPCSFYTLVSSHCR